MAITSEGSKISLKAVIYEDEVVELRKTLMKLAPEELTFELSDCDDIHLAVLQQMLAYKKMYACKFEFGESVKTYQQVIEGFDENDCNS